MASASQLSSERIEGWKSIGAFFGRDRTTAIRWARDRNLPVHRIPGGKTSTTFALRHELEAWVRSSSLDGTKAVARGRAPAASLVVVDSAPDPGVQEDYLRARDWIMGRNARAIEQAIILLRDITQRAPDFAASYIALAEALVLSREFGERSDGQAFPPAQFALRTGLRLNPSLASGHRVAGFIAYWWDHDITAARQSFRHALNLAPADAITHFWYGNILADHGEFAEGIECLNRARALHPGSVPILTDLAWAQWSAGDQARPLAALQDIARDHPRFTVAHEYLAYIALITGDYAGYVAELTLLATLRMNPVLAARAAALTQALGIGPHAGHRCILQQALDDLASEPGRTSAWAVLVAAVGEGVVAGQARELLEKAVRRGEHWGESGFVRGIRMNRPGLDPLLDRLTLR